MNRSRSSIASNVLAAPQSSQCRALAWDCISAVPLSKHMEGRFGCRARYGKARRFRLVCLVRRKLYCQWRYFEMEQEIFDQRDMTILIVDDESRIRDFVRMNLELEHYHVLEANNGLEALDKLRENLPDLVLLDVMMPEMDGFETLRSIREVSTVPVIMLTVRQNEQDRIHGLDLGADDYIAKPFSPRELLLRIRALLRRSLMPAPAGKTEVVVDPDLKI